MSSWVTIGQKCRVSMSHSVYCRNKRSKSDLLSTGMMVRLGGWYRKPEWASLYATMRIACSSVLLARHSDTAGDVIWMLSFNRHATDKHRQTIVEWKFDDTRSGRNSRQGKTYFSYLGWK